MKCIPSNTYITVLVLLMMYKYNVWCSTHIQGTVQYIIHYNAMWYNTYTSIHTMYSTVYVMYIQYILDTVYYLL